MSELPNTQRLNTEPTILLGLTASEVLILALAATAVWIPVALIIAHFVRVWTMAAALSLVGIGASIWTGGLLMRTVKRQRPDGYYQQRVHRWMQGLGMPLPVIRKSGAWDTQRSLGARRSSASWFNPRSTRSSS